MTDSKKLIEEARAGLAAFDEYWGDGAPVNLEHGRPWELIRGLLSVFEKPQGEPSDAQVEAAGALLYGISWGTDIADPNLVRDALRAAGGVR